MKHFTRRAFLKALGGAGAALPFAHSLRHSVAEASTGWPLRFIVLFTPHGMNREYWAPQGTETDFNITYPNAMLAPLDRHKSKLLILEGLDYRVLYEYQETGHEGAPVTFLTGSKMNKSSGDPLPENASLDQAIAARIGGDTPFRSLHLDAFHRFGGQDTWNSISFTSTGSRVPIERNPYNVYMRFLDGFSADGAPTEASLLAAAKKRKLLDYWRKDASALRSRLAGTERFKLDSHLDALSEIERRLELSATRRCVRPTAPPSYDRAELGEMARMPELVQLHMDVISHIIACDLTRVVTMTMLAAPEMPWLGFNESIHDDIAHVTNSSGTAGTEARLKMSKVQQWYAEQLAYLMDRLAAIPEGDGTALDHTLILWGNELGDPAGHSNVGVPTVLAGGANGRFRMGRYLKLRPGVTKPLEGWKGGGTQAPNLVAHNHLLVSIAQAFGMDVNTFGQADYQGPLPGLT